MPDGTSGSEITISDNGDDRVIEGVDVVGFSWIDREAAVYQFLLATRVS
jgi:hypothetical protein